MHDEPLAVDVKRAAEMLSISPRSIQNYLRLKIIRGRKLGRRTVIPVSELARLLRSDQPSPTPPKKRNQTPAAVRP